MNDIYMTVIGNIATDLRSTTTEGGVAVTSFRVASKPRRYGPNGWVDGHTSFVTVKCWRGLADNANDSLRKGQPVIVHGRVTVRPWERDGRTGTSVDIDADAIGHDLRWGTTEFRKTARASQEREGTESAAAPASSFDAKDIMSQSPAAQVDGEGWALPGGEGRNAAA